MSTNARTNCTTVPHLHNVATSTGRLNVTAQRGTAWKTKSALTSTSASKPTFYSTIHFTNITQNFRTKTNNCQYLCVNSIGSYECECPNGFIKQHNTCVDRDEVIFKCFFLHFSICDIIVSRTFQCLRSTRYLRQRCRVLAL